MTAQSFPWAVVVHRANGLGIRHPGLPTLASHHSLHPQAGLSCDPAVRVTGHLRAGMGSGRGLGLLKGSDMLGMCTCPDPEEGALPETCRKCGDTPVAPREDGEKPAVA